MRSEMSTSTRGAFPTKPYEIDGENHMIGVDQYAYRPTTDEKSALLLVSKIFTNRPGPESDNRYSSNLMAAEELVLASPGLILGSFTQKNKTVYYFAVMLDANGSVRKASRFLSKAKQRHRRATFKINN